jgi:16S rRNA processing protein RimM
MQVFLGERHETITIQSVRSADEALLISFEGYTDRDQVAVFRNQLVYVRSDALPNLPEGQYYHHQLIGMQVVDVKGAVQGTLTEILETGANDVYIVKSEAGTEILLPAIEAVILEVDLEKKQVTVRLPEWT